MSETVPSLITRDRLILACSAAAALIIPVWLLADDSPAPEPPLAGRLTSFGRAEIEQPADALAAPLFNPDRTAPEELEGDGNMTADAGASATPAAPPPSLVGLIVGRGTPGLALVRGSDGQTKLLHPGETIDGWRIGAISASGATFDMNGQQEHVGLNFGKAASPSLPSTEPPAVSPPFANPHPDQPPAGPTQ
jgi:hypothetical protein